MKHLQNFTIISIVAFVLQMSFSVSAQSLYEQGPGDDPTWKYIIDNDLIPVGKTSTKGIKGTDIDVNQDHPAISSSPYANRSIQSGTAIHTLGNATVKRSDFPKWSRWYQEDGNTQIFRLFKGEINVRNQVQHKPRIEAELDNHSKGTKIINNADWVEWSGTYTVVEPVESNIFQIWSNDDYVLMLTMKNDGRIQLNPRNGNSHKTMVSDATGKSFDIRVRDYGNRYVVYLNGEEFFGRNYSAKYGNSRAAHFRWGIYASRKSSDKNGVPKDGLMFVTGAQRKYSNDTTDPGNNTPPAVSFANPSGNTTLQEGYDTFEVTVNASDGDGSISNVKLYVDNNLIRQENKAPYTWGQGNSADELLGLSAGKHTIKAEATDNDGAKTSKSITVTVGDSNGGGNEAPNVSFASPSSNLTVQLGYDLEVVVNASDSDGTISNVKLYIDNTLVRQEKSAPYEWGHAGSPNPEEVNGLAAGTYTFKAVATDNEGETSSKTFQLTVQDGGDPDPDPDPDPSDCSFGTPLSQGISAKDKVAYNNVYVVGSGGPSLGNFRKFTINWVPQNNGLYQFAINTNNGSPDWYVDFKNSMTFQLQNASPEITLSNTGFAGLDGLYWVAETSNSLILVSKNKSYSIHFSNASNAPGCTNKINDFENTGSVQISQNPFGEQLVLTGIESGNTLVEVVDFSGRNILKSKIPAGVRELRLPTGDIPQGVYFVKIVSATKSSQVIKAIKK